MFKLKIKVDNDKYIIYLRNPNIRFDIEDEEDIKDKIKDIVLNIKNKRNISICGFYKVKVYQNNKYGMILEMEKEDDIEFLRDFCDLKVVFFNNSKMLLKFGDYFLIEKNNVYYYDNNFYIDIDDLTDKEVTILSEFSEVIYGEKRLKLGNLLQKIKD